MVTIALVNAGDPNARFMRGLLEQWGRGKKECLYACRGVVRLDLRKVKQGCFFSSSLEMGGFPYRDLNTN